MDIARRKAQTLEEGGRKPGAAELLLDHGRRGQPTLRNPVVQRGDVRRTIKLPILPNDEVSHPHGKVPRSAPRSRVQLGSGFCRDYGDALSLIAFKFITPNPGLLSALTKSLVLPGATIETLPRFSFRKVDQPPVLGTVPFRVCPET